MRYRLFSRGILRTCASVLVLSAATPALATEADADEDRSYAPTDIVVTARLSGYVVDDGSTSTKTPTPLIETPQAVTVVTRDQLDDQNVRQLGEALRFVAGISMESGEGHRDEVFIRGQETTADFYLNGLRDDAQYYRSLYNVERVEVLKGSNALTFGRGGGGGVINRVSKTPDLVEMFTSGSASIDTFGAWSLSADVNQPLGENGAARINATYEEFNNHRDFYDGRFFGIAPTVKFRLGERTGLVLAYSYEDDRRLTDRGVPSFEGLPLDDFDKTLFGDPDFNEARSKVHIARFRLDHALSDGLSVNLTGQYANYDKIYANIVPSGVTPDGTMVSLGGYRDGTKRENWIAQGNLVWQGDTGAVGHTLLAGFEFSKQDTQNFRDTVSFVDPDANPVPLGRTITVPEFTLNLLARNRDSDLSVFSAYLQDQVEIGEVIELIAGIRFESFDLETVDLTDPAAQTISRKDEKWSPRFGIVVKPQDRLSIYASYTESFLPQAGDQFLILSENSASFEPEKFENIEIGVKWAPRPELLFTAAAFQLDRSNTQADDPTGMFTVLTGKSRTKGVELQLSGDIADNWHVNLGYTYLDGKILSQVGSTPAGRTLQQVPKHHIAAWMRYDLTEQFGLGGGIVHASKQFASFSNNVVLPSYTRVDVAAYYTVNDAVSLQINVNNLFDEDYYASAHGDNNIQPATPLSANFGVRARF